MTKNIAGIDYGSKLAGTTVISWIQNDNIYQSQSNKKQDADLFIKDFVAKNNIEAIYLDAPLSLPAAYQKNEINKIDFFYRACDKTCKAMSPMFLGGLTARAIKLKYDLSSTIFYETYPMQLIKTLGLLEYKKDNLELQNHILSELSSFTINTIIKNRHQIDSLFALYSGIRHQNNNHSEFGDPNEGIIII